MPSPLRAQYLWTAFLGALSLGSVIFTLSREEIASPFLGERVIDSQDDLDTLAADMQRLLQSVSDWSALCTDPYAYFQSATVHGNFQLSLRQHMDHEGWDRLPQAERDAVGRCLHSKSHPTPAQYRLCFVVKENVEDRRWFDEQHLFELSVQFREKGSRLLSDCSQLNGASPVELQAYFSAYGSPSAELKMNATRISGGLRLPLTPRL